MKPIIVVRRFEERDLHQMQEVIRNYVLAKFSSAFWFCIFREVRIWDFYDEKFVDFPDCSNKNLEFSIFR